MNKFKKYCPNVFVIESNESFNKGDVVDVQAKYNIVECEVFNLVAQKGDLKYYSYIRTDGLNKQTYAQKKAEKFETTASNRSKKSDEWRNKSNEGADFLRLAEPIKIGHHSEHRHRALIDRNCKRMEKSVALQDEAESYDNKAKYWESRKNDIDLSMPESLEYFEFKLEEAIKYQQGLKDGIIPREHSYSLQYATKAVKDLKDKFNTAKKLWGDQ